MTGVAPARAEVLAALRHGQAEILAREAPGRGTEDGTHLCPVRRCKWRVPDDRLMCPADWRRVPKAVQRAVWAAYDGGRGQGTPAHRATMLRAVDAANRERDRERAGGDRR